MSDALPETDRLIFREMTNDDLADIQRMFADEYALRFYPSMLDIDEVQRWIDWSVGNYRQYGFGLWALISKETGAFVGDCGLTYQEVSGAQELEIGYHLEASQRGHGYALEAARSALRYGFARTNAPVIFSVVAPSNDASIRVAQRLHQDRSEFTNERGLSRLAFSTPRERA